MYLFRNWFFRILEFFYNLICIYILCKYIFQKYTSLSEIMSNSSTGTHFGSLKQILRDSNGIKKVSENKKSKKSQKYKKLLQIGNNNLIFKRQWKIHILLNKNNFNLVLPLFSFTYNIVKIGEW